jgi:hypothetical protein
MSATNRKAGTRRASDYYYTPLPTITAFFEALEVVEPLAVRGFNTVLDPCAGGDALRPCAYPTALFELAFKTCDIRPDSPAENIIDYLTALQATVYDAVISNPPFGLWEAFAIKALSEVKEGGYVCFLLRLNAFGGQERKVRFWSHYPAKYCFVHSKRPFPDATEYAHFVWQKGYSSTTSIIVI